MKRRLIAVILMTAFTVTACGTEGVPDRGSISDMIGNDDETPTEAPTEAPTAAPTEEPEPTPQGTIEPAAYDGEVRPLQVDIETQYDGWSSDDWNYSAHIQAPEITLEEDGFDALAKSVNNYGRSLQEFATNNDLPDMINMCKEMQAAVPEPDNGVYMVSEYTTTVARADSTVTSFLTQQYVDYAGAHPGTVFTTKNFDSATGDALDIYAVVESDQIDGLPELIADSLIEKYGEEPFYDADNLAGTIDDTLGMNSDLVFTVDYFGITFYFSPYELAPYAFGAQTVTFRYEDYPDLVKDVYQQTSENFIYPLDPYNTNTLPDGRELELQIVTFGEEYEEGYAIEASLDGNHRSYEIYDAFDMAPWLVHCDDRDYMYLKWSTYNDYGLISVCDLNGDIVGEPEEFPGSFMGSPTNPENIKIYNRGDLLSTVGIYRYYSVGKDGMPEPKTDYFMVSSDLSITLKRDMTFECRDDFDAPESAAEEKVKKGTKLTFYAENDDEGWVDFTLPDGRFVRVYVDCSDYPRTVDGIDMDDVFADLFWAG